MSTHPRRTSAHERTDLVGLSSKASRFASGDYLSRDELTGLAIDSAYSTHLVTRIAAMSGR